MCKCSPEAMNVAVCAHTAHFQTSLRCAEVSGGHIPGPNRAKETIFGPFVSLLKFADPLVVFDSRPAGRPAVSFQPAPLRLVRGPRLAVCAQRACLQ